MADHSTSEESHSEPEPEPEVHARPPLHRRARSTTALLVPDFGHSTSWMEIGPDGRMQETQSHIASLARHNKIVVVMVGLPARGKTYISKALSRYLRWLDIKTRTFNVGEYRRVEVGASKDANFFDPQNAACTETREKIAQHCLEDLVTWLTTGEGVVAIYDATNTTRERRDRVKEYCEGKGLRVFFIESICNDPKIVMINVNSVKVQSDDYKNKSDSNESAQDFMKRIQMYEKAYVPLDRTYDEPKSYVKLFASEEHYEVHRASGYLESRMLYYLLNLRIVPGTIYFSRHGETLYNKAGRIGGNSELAPNGHVYAAKLVDYFEEHDITDVEVWASTLRRTKQTAKPFVTRKLTSQITEWRALDEIDAGVCDGLTYAEIEERYPAEMAGRDKDKFNYRYPGGESYADLTMRLEPVIMELERNVGVTVVIAHQAVLRCLLAYFLDKSQEELPYINVPLHTVMKLVRGAYGNTIESTPLNVQCVDTYRPKPKH